MSGIEHVADLQMARKTLAHGGWQYDAMGRVKQFYNPFGDAQGGWSAAYEVSRTYNLPGAVTSQKYPSGHTVNYVYDMECQIISLAGNLDDGLQRTYVSAVDYGPWGTVTRERLRTNAPGFNKLHYNIRGQLCEVRVSNVSDECSGELGALGNHYIMISVLCGSDSDNNGSVLMSQITLNSYYVEDRYSYDSLNCLTSVHEYSNGVTLTGTQQYDYDRWGNRTFKLTYDNAGNLTRDTYTGASNHVYDADNRITAAQDNLASWSYYSYNANGQRIRRKVNNQETWQIYGIDGELEYGYRNAQLLVTAGAGAPQPASSLCDRGNCVRITQDRYTYTRNNPLIYIDADGIETTPSARKGCSETIKLVVRRDHQRIKFGIVVPT